MTRLDADVHPDNLLYPDSAAENIIDLGDITTARGTEIVFTLWARLLAKTGNALINFNVKAAGAS